MRFFEILIPLLLVVWLLWPLITAKKRPLYINLLPSIALVLTILHLVVEKYRWQMVPLYLFVLVAFVLSIIDLIRPRSETFERRSWASLGIMLGLLVLVLAVSVPALLPVPRVPEPSGPYQVGTVTLVLEDASRKELYSQDPDEARRFMIQVWYPAAPPDGALPAPWMEDARIVAPAIAGWLGLPEFFLDHLELARTSSYAQTPVDRSGAPYPVLIFSHGWGGFRAQNTYQVQELASHGYVVVGMEHPYGTAATVFPDGKVVYNNPGALPDDVTDAEYDRAARQLVDQWAGDMTFALDFLEQENSDDPEVFFAGALDLENVGVFGHSTGGGATIQFCGTDERCKAGLTMDAYMTPVSEGVLDNGAAQPFLFLFSEQWSKEKNSRLFERFYSHVTQPSRVLTILGTAHFDFSDLPMLSPLAPQLGLKGPLNGARVLRIVNDYSLAFFDQYLKDISTTLLEGPSPLYPEVQYDH